MCFPIFDKLFTIFNALNSILYDRFYHGGLKDSHEREKKITETCCVSIFSKFLRSALLLQSSSALTFKLIRKIHFIKHTAILYQIFLWLLRIKFIPE